MSQEAVGRRPTRNEYPDAPPEVFTAGFPTNFRNYGIQKSVQPCGDGYFDATASIYDEPHGSIEGYGSGASANIAWKVACDELLARLHERGVLHLLFELWPPVCDEQLWQQHQGEIRDVFNFASAHGALPNLIWGNQEGHPSLRIQVKVKELRFSVTGLGKTREIAEAVAVLRFKREAMGQLAACPSAKGDLRVPVFLNCENIENFWEFMKHCKGATFEFGSRVARSGFTIGVKITRGGSEDMVTIKSGPEIAKVLAQITAAFRLPDMQQLLEAYRCSLRNGRFILPPPVQNLAVSWQSLSILEESVNKANQHGLQSMQTPQNRNSTWREQSQLRAGRAWSSLNVQSRSQDLLRQQQNFRNSTRGTDMQQYRQGLPMMQHRQRILNTISEGTFSVIIGDTGSGKTTQVPQIVLEDAVERGSGGECTIICTQPRRIAATSVARRVAEERLQRLGDTVGYQVRGDKQLPEPRGSILFCTIGVLLAQLKSGVDQIFNDTSHIMVDEVHERSWEVDFLLVLLKTAAASRSAARKRVPKIILMSATINAELFAKYFCKRNPAGTTVDCPQISVPGRMFAVTRFYLRDILDSMDGCQGQNAIRRLREAPSKRFLKQEFSIEKSKQKANGNTINAIEDDLDWEQFAPSLDPGMADFDDNNTVVPTELIGLIIGHVAEKTSEGSILVFLPGKMELLNVQKAMQQRGVGVDFGDARKFKISLLHSEASKEEQDEVFRPLPVGCRRVILSTNIAETSLTIPDVQHIIDSGKQKEQQYGHERGIEALITNWVSQANCKQRAGRAGRVRAGNYFAVFMKERYDSMRATGIAEIQRSDLQRICLAIKSHDSKTTIDGLLSKAIEPPQPIAVSSAVERLQALGALTRNEEITPLGDILSDLVLPPSLGKMVVMGIIFRCLDPMIILAASADERLLFRRPLEEQAESVTANMAFLNGSNSEHLTVLNAFMRVRHLQREGGRSMWSWYQSHYISIRCHADVGEAARNIEATLMRKGLLPYRTEAEKQCHEACFGFEYGDAVLNENSSHEGLIRALIVSGFAPNIAVHLPGSTQFRTVCESNLKITGSSLFGGMNSRTQFNGAILTSSSLVRGNKKQLSLRQNTEATPLMTALFGGFLGRCEKQGSDVILGDWMRFRVAGATGSPRLVSALMGFRNALDKVLDHTLRSLQDHGAAGNGVYLAASPLHHTVVAGVIALLDSDHCKLRMMTESKLGLPIPTTALDGNPLEKREAIFWGEDNIGVSWQREYEESNPQREVCDGRGDGSASSEEL